jgi:hypothetical protein
VTAVGRSAWARWWPAGLAWALWVLALLGVATIPWFDHLLRQAGRPELTQLHAVTLPSVVAALIAVTVGAVLAGRRPRHPVGWLLLVLGLAVTASGVVDGYARYGLLARPGALPAARWLAVFSPATLYLGFVCVGLVLLLTPSGSLPSPRWRWWVRLVAAGPVVFLVALAVGPGLVIAPYDPVIDQVTSPALAGAVGVAIAVAVAIAVGGLAVGVWSLVVRFRRARGVEREQLRWVAFAAALTVPPAALILIGVVVGATGAVLVVLAVGVCMALLPLAIGAAILRYRLYDLDRIISRTLAYGLLTILLGGAYVGVALGLGQLLGQDTSLAVAGATLVVAALFQPARRRIQAAVDRRFNRRRHDAAHTIAAFSSRLRQQVDLDTLTVELLAVVDQTMQPTSVSLWLRPSVSGSQAQSGTGAPGSARQPTPASWTVRTTL